MTSTILEPYVTRTRPGPFRRALFVSMLVFTAIIYGLMAVVMPIQLLVMMLTPIFVIIAIILWMLPDIGGVQTARMQSLLIAFLGFSIAWPNYLAFNLPGLPWVTPTRITLFWLVAVFILNVSTSRELRDGLRDSVSAMPRYMKVFWLLWLVTTISIVFSDQLTSSINRYVNNQIYWTMIFFATALVATQPGFVVRVARILLWSTVIVLIYSLYEAMAQRVIWIDYLPPFMKIDPDVIEMVMEAQSRAGTEAYRVRGPYIVALYFSEYLTMALPFFVHATAQERRFPSFMALLAATLGLIVLMYLTDSRSAMVGIVIVLAAYPLFIAAQQLAKKNRSILGSAVVYGYPAIAVILGLIIVFWRRAHVLVLGGGQHQSSSDARNEQWAMAWPKLASHPLGYGTARGNDALGFFSPSGKGTVDSYYITVMMDSGVLALPLFLAVFLIPAFVAFQYFRDAKTPEMLLLAPLALALINFTIVKGVLSTEHTVPLAFIFIGCIVGLVWQRQRAASTAATPTGASLSQGPSLPARRFVPALAGPIGRA